MISYEVACAENLPDAAQIEWERNKGPNAWFSSYTMSDEFPICAAKEMNRRYMEQHPELHGFNERRACGCAKRGKRITDGRARPEPRMH